MAPPSYGWVRAIRRSIGMTAQQLAARIGVSQQSVSHLENNEKNGTIRLTSLKRLAEAMDCQLVYALVPREGSLEAMIRAQAYKKAKEIISSVDQTMSLESQQVGGKSEKIAALAEELVQNITSQLWEEDDE